MCNLCVFIVKCFCCACYPFCMGYVCVKGSYVYCGLYCIWRQWVRDSEECVEEVRCVFNV